MDIRVRLPAEYQEVEYVESPGFCWIDITIPVAENSVISSTAVFQYTGTATNNFWLVGDGRLFTLQHEYGRWTGWYNDGTKASYTAVGGSGLNAKISACYYNFTRESSNDIVWRVFGRYGYSESTLENVPPCKIWSTSLTVNGAKAFDLVPCYRISDGEIGMYDLVSKTFFTNAGTGTFTKGPDLYVDGGLLQIRRQILMANPHQEIATGSPVATFQTDMQAPMQITIPFSPVQDLSNGDPSPSNVCPISGWTGATIKAMGANLLVPDDPNSPSANYTFNSTGRVTYNTEYGAYQQNAPGVAYTKHAGQARRLFIAPFPMTITFSVDVYEFGNNYGLRFYLSRDGESSSRITDIHGTTMNQWRHYEYTTTLDKGGYIYLICYTMIYWKNLQVIYQGSTSEYIPYTGTTLPISWQSEAGTVYGGTLTINEDGSGTLTQTHVSYTITGGFTKGGDASGTYEGENLWEAWNYLGQGALQGWKYPNTYTVSQGWPNVILSNFKNKVFAPGVGRISFTRDGTPYVRIWLKESLLSDVSTSANAIASINAWCAENPIQACYDLKTPITYTLTASQLKSLIGVNNVWSDLNGDTTTVQFWKH